MKKLRFLILKVYWLDMAVFIYRANSFKVAIILALPPHDAQIQNKRFHLVPETAQFKITQPTFRGDQGRVGVNTRVAAAEEDQQAVIVDQFIMWIGQRIVG
jgi:hypothetical protein